MLLQKPIGKQVDQCMMQYSQKPYLCSCLHGMQALQLAIHGVESTDGSNVILRVSCDDPIICLGKKHQCDCEIRFTSGTVKVPIDAWKVNLHKSSQLTCANVLWETCGNEFRLDASHIHAFVVPDPISKSVFPKQMTVGEVCAGGFGGWSHASYLCCKLGVPVKQGFAIELSTEICNVYAKTWHDATIVGDSLDFFYQSSAFHDGSKFPLFNADVALGWWVTCMGGTHVDAGCLSAPCQPFSAASSGRGLYTHDGWVTIDGIISLAYLGVKMILLEQVSAIRRHEHWSLIMMVFHLSGYRLLSEKVVNLNRVSPQNRERVIMVWIQKNEACVGDFQAMMDFPVLPPFSLKSFGAIQDDLGSMAEQTQVKADALDMYLDHSLLPQKEGNKRARLDLMRYRIRQSHEAFGCIMATYGFQHELPRETLKSGGLYGNLLQIGQEVRFLSGMECLILMMPQCRCFIPVDRKLHMKIIGNSICSAHAMLALGVGIHALALDDNIPSVQALVLQTIQQRLCFHNCVVHQHEDGWWLQPIDHECGMPKQISLISPTINDFQPMEVVFKSGNWILRGIIPRKMFLPEVMDALGFRGNTEVERVIEGSEKIIVILTKAVVMPIVHMNWHSKTSQNVLIMMDDMFCMVPRKHVSNVGECLEILTAMRVPLIEQKDMVNMCGFVHDASDQCPAIAILVPQGVDKMCRFEHSLSRFHFRSGEVAMPFPAPQCRQMIRCLKQRGIGAMCNAFGWSVHVVTNHDIFKPWTIVFRRDLKGTVISTDDFRSLLHLWMLQLLMPWDVKCQDHNIAVEIHVKYYGSIYWKGRVHKDNQIGIFIQPWNYLMSLTGDECPIRVVVQGRNVSNDVIISSVTQHEKMNLYWILPAWGGGAKDNAKFVAKNQLAHQLLGKGIPVTKVASYVETIVQAVGASKVIKEIKENDANTKWKRVQTWIEEAGLQPLDPSAEFDKAATRIQNAIRKKRNNRNSMIDISKLQIEPSFFIKEDGTPAIVLQTLSAATSGICLLSEHEASTWINADLPLSSEELAGLVIGNKCPSHDPGNCCRVTVPVRDESSQPLVISACMHQLGGKKIKFNMTNSSKVTVAKSVVLGVTCFQDECGDCVWAEVLKNPVRTVISIFEKEGVTDFIASAPWGRSWRCGNTPSSPENATSVQFHIRAKYTSLQRILAVSGIRAVYITPKDDERGLLAGWAIVWLKKSKPEILVDITKMGTEHCGIVRANKGLGVRVAQANFSKAFAELRPHDKPPNALEAKLLFRLQLVPLGANAEIVEEITKSHMGYSCSEIIGTRCMDDSH